MIVELRSYLKSRILDVKSTSQDIDDYNGENDVAENEINQGYKIYFGQASGSVLGNHFEKRVPISIELYSYLVQSKKMTEIFDELYDLAISVEENILDPIQVKNQNAFTDIFPESILLEALPTNDNVIRAKINLNAIIKRTY
jgi:hypothetical protein